MSEAKRLKGMQEELECPVCFEIPRELPIPACPKGHIVCKTCRKNVETCPTCRADFRPGGVNIPVGAMIQKIPHKCKFSRYGCDVQMKLEDLVQHEKRCPERLVRCPDDACGKEVQIKKCGIEHFRTHLTGVFFNPDRIPYVYQMTVHCGFGDTRDYLRNWDGISKNRGEECNLEEDKEETNIFNQLAKTFFVKTRYVAARRCFLLIVMMADLPEVAAQYMVHYKISSKDGRFEIDYKCPVISIEELPDDNRGTETQQMFLEARSWNVSYHNMKNLFRFYDFNHGRGKIGNMEWQVSFRPQVKIFKK